MDRNTYEAYDCVRLIILKREDMKMKECLTDTLQLQFIFRIFLAGICGMIIGLERKNRSKEAGIRTHFVVACGAALMMVVSKYAFFDVIKEGIYSGVEVRLDPSRIASTIASGIGFLGAGMIFVHRNTITGLTTAAGIWATSGVGMAVGAGLYSIGICATVIILLAQIILHKNFKWLKLPKMKTLVIRGVDKKNYQEEITEKLEGIGVQIRDVSIDNDTETKLKKYSLTIEIPHDVVEESILSLITYNSSLKSNA